MHRGQDGERPTRVSTCGRDDLPPYGGADAGHRGPEPRAPAGRQAAPVGAADLGPGARVDLRHPGLTGRRRGTARGRPVLRQRRARASRRCRGARRRPPSSTSTPTALAAVRQNLHAVGLDGEPATLVRAALPGWLEGGSRRELRPRALRPALRLRRLAGAARRAPCRRGRHGICHQPIALPEGWVVTRERRYGGTLVTVAHRSSAGS